MLGRKTYTKEELDSATSAMAGQLGTYRDLVRAVDATGDAKAAAALAAFEPRFLGHLTMALDRYFVHRIRAVSGKDGNPLNEVELLVDAQLADGAVPQSTVIKYDPERSVVGLHAGDPVALALDDFERLSTAFLQEVDGRFVQVSS